MSKPFVSVRVKQPSSAGGPEQPRPPLGKVLKRFWPFIYPYRWVIVFGTCCVILALLLSKAPPLVTRYLVDQVLTPALKQRWTPELYERCLRLAAYSIGVLVAVAAFNALVSRARMYLMHRAGAALVLDIRLALYEHLQKLSLGFYETRQTGEIMSRVTGDVNAMEDLITHVSDSLLTDALNLVVTLGILFYLSTRLTLVALVPIPALVFLMLRFSRVIRPVYRKIRDRLGEINAKLQDNLSGIRVIKAFHTETDEARRFESESREYYDMQMSGIRLWTGAFPLIRFIQGMGNLMVLAYGAYLLLQPKPIITLGDLFAFTAYVSQLYEPIGSLFRTYDVVLRAGASGERIMELFETAPDVADEPEAVELPPVEGHVQFEGVSFKYQTGEEVLTDVSLKAQPGEVIALVGRSGAGKTSIINLIPRFYDPIAGRVTIDGYDVRRATQTSLRRQIAIVLQDPFLFNGTVKENIRYAKPDATDEEIEEAAKAAYAHEFIIDLPSGYDTEIGERGVKLSGGQKQRIAIARALLADRRILILDEATSMVDSEAEYLIQQALQRLMQGRTTFVIAHRLSTVKNADKIVILEDGRVVEEGNHATLLAKQGAYAQMYYAQFRLALEEPPALEEVTARPSTGPPVPSLEEREQSVA